MFAIPIYARHSFSYFSPKSPEYGVHRPRMSFDDPKASYSRYGSSSSQEHSDALDFMIPPFAMHFANYHLLPYRTMHAHTVKQIEHLSPHMPKSPPPTFKPHSPTLTGLSRTKQPGVLLCSPRVSSARPNLSEPATLISPLALSSLLGKPRSTCHVESGLGAKTLQPGQGSDMKTPSNTTPSKEEGGERSGAEADETSQGRRPENGRQCQGSRIPGG
ncbi:hypothetical protein P152DRAFT_448977 [Eremomyces bilateralis CBS 781.70]|uniref:Uncharacterized protein n=1 Tax=Eremomyces bilateralis CBS 781.70 TaxID=1392243 RepID=A0A6G1G4V7_9PEZI|nr:uncharacterized protein P152DRAFT_448977 [Eremomyces bilateralis CBS 781.70]KAF1812869.1 hypothetical protein P152DRAFT_448977 [Eremomyces bilateralis CBS 781.70]